MAAENPVAKAARQLALRCRACGAIMNRLTPPDGGWVRSCALTYSVGGTVEIVYPDAIYACPACEQCGTREQLAQLREDAAGAAALPGDLLDDIAAYLNDHADADDNGRSPNAAMSLWVRLAEARGWRP